MGNIQEIGSIDQFLKVGKAAVIDFYGNNCQACRMLAPLFDSLSTQFKGKMSFAKMNIDDNANIAGQLGIKSIPTLIFFQDGKEVDRHIGVLSRAAFQKKIESLISFKRQEKEVKMDWQVLKLVKPNEATGEAKEVYDEIVRVEGARWLVPLWGFFAIRPKLLRHVWNTLRNLEIDEGPTPRPLMSAISLVVATGIGCLRCANYHEETLRQRLGVSKEYVDKIRNFESSDLPEKEKVALRFGRKVGLGIELEDSEFKAVRDHGYTDEQIVEMAYIAIFEAGLARHAFTLARFEDALDWPEENTPSEFYKKHADQ